MARGWVRVGLVALGAPQAAVGAYAVAAPAHWFAAFPFGRGWAGADGTFNHHLAVDAGAGFLATGAALLLAAWWGQRRTTQLALLTLLAHIGPHLAYHARYSAVGLPAVDQTLTWTLLALQAVLAIGLLLVSGENGARSGRAEGEDVRAHVRAVPRRPRNPALRLVFAAAARRLGAVPHSWRVLARCPAMLAGRVAGDAVTAAPRHVERRLTTLAALRTATLVDCPFCIDIGAAVGMAAGLQPTQVRDLTAWRTSTAFDGTERAVLAFADAMTQTPCEVPDDLAEQLRAHLGEPGLVELAAVIGHENARARTNRALGVGSQGFAGASCPLPQVPA